MAAIDDGVGEDVDMEPRPSQSTEKYEGDDAG